MANPSRGPPSRADGNRRYPQQSNMFENSESVNVGGSVASTSAQNVYHISGGVHLLDTPRVLLRQAHRHEPYRDAASRTSHSKIAKCRRRKVARRILEPIHRTLDAFGGIELALTEFGRPRGRGGVDIEQLTTAEVYALSMLRSGRGLACWQPEPFGAIEGVRGVIPGDVGVYSDGDGFKAIFNLWDEDSIRATGQKISFHRRYHAPRGGTWKRAEELCEGDVVAQGMTSSRAYDEDSNAISHFKFRYQPPFRTGAVLALTSAAEREQLDDIRSLKDHIIDYAELIYVHSGSPDEALYIITGCVKSEKWALASFRHPMVAPHDTLKLVNRGLGAGRARDPNLGYAWTHMGGTEARIGPSRDAGKQPAKDQSLFLRGFKLDSRPFRFRTNAKRAVQPSNRHPGPGGPSSNGGNGSSRHGRGHDRSPGPGGGGQGGSAGGWGPIGGSNHSNLGYNLSGNHTITKAVESDKITSSLALPSSHPCDLLNQWLLQKTGADFALCHDESWITIFDESLPRGPAQDTLEDNMGESAWDALEEECFTVEKGVAVFLSPWARESDPDSLDKHATSGDTTSSTPDPDTPPILEAPENRTSNRVPHDSADGSRDPKIAAAMVPLQLKATDSVVVTRKSDDRTPGQERRPERHPHPSSAAELKVTSGVVILVMGQTGAGKSHFINRAAGGEKAHVSDSLSTDDFKVRSYTIDNPKIRDSADPRSKVVLVDTPGLNNANKDFTDLEAVKRIGAWLNDCCSDNLSAGGIIFLHDITEDRATVYTDTHAWPLKYFESPALRRNIVLTTGKWDLDFVQSKVQYYQDREQKLKDTDAWKKLLHWGARSCRYEGNPESAWNTINTLLEKPLVDVKLLQSDFGGIQQKLTRIKPPRPGFWKKFKNLFSKK